MFYIFFVQPMRIHCSSATQQFLEPCPEYDIEERGTLTIKGKGEMTTYWVSRSTTMQYCSVHPPSLQRAKAFLHGSP